MQTHILLVEDEKPLREQVADMLRLEGFDVTEAEDGQAAIDLLANKRPHIILCDVAMPNMDGYEFLVQVRDRGFTKHTPIIMLSAKSESKERIKCYKLGAQDYLTKPFNPEELEELVKKNLFPIHYAVEW